MKKNKFLSNKYITGSLLVIAGLLLGWMFFHHSAPTENSEQTALLDQSKNAKQIWTCAMHPQIKMDKPGQCPICGMDLIPLQSANAEIDEQAIQMSESAIKLAEVQTSIVGKERATKEVLLYGKIKPDERLLQSQTAHVPGRIEQLFINVTGEVVTKGQLIARIYSPELISAQKELLEAVTMQDKYPALPEAAREKLRNWKLSDQQIHDIESSGKVTSTFDIYANTSGIITSLKVNEGDYIGKGAVLFEVADLSKVWAVFDAYETDLPWISMGQKVEFTAQAIPGKTYDGTVSFIDPVIESSTRIARVRVELSNVGFRLKPEMFINGIVKSNLTKAGQQITIPQSAVLWTGKRSIVYVKIPGTETPEFKMREITLGPSVTDAYVMEDGLAIGDEIVTNGTFSVDAAAQLAGKPSMMNPEGGKMTVGSMPGMDMGNNGTNKEERAKPEMDMGTTSGNKENEKQPAMDMKDGSKPMKMEKQMVKVSGNCEMCKDRIEKEAKSVNGVVLADWNVETKMLQVEFDASKTTLDAIQKVIALAGHDTGKYKAPDDVYNKLPKCCLYRK